MESEGDEGEEGRGRGGPLKRVGGGGERGGVEEKGRRRAWLATRRNE